jgi:hypothetical protein
VAQCLADHVSPRNGPILLLRNRVHTIPRGGVVVGRYDLIQLWLVSGRVDHSLASHRSTHLPEM